MTNNQNDDNRTAASNIETTIAKLSVLGGILSTLGVSISTAAAIMALEDLQRLQSSNESKLTELEKQIEYLREEIDQQKR